MRGARRKPHPPVRAFTNGLDPLLLERAFSFFAFSARTFAVAAAMISACVPAVEGLRLDSRAAELTQQASTFPPVLPRLALSFGCGADDVLSLLLPLLAELGGCMTGTAALQGAVLARRCTHALVC